MTHHRVPEVLLPIALALAATALLLERRPSPPLPPEVAPRPSYLGSAGCEMCHPSEYASWHQTFHRTMTRRADALRWDGVESPALPAELGDGQFSFRLTRQGSGVFAQGPNLHTLAQLLYEAGEQAKLAGGARASEAAIERALERVRTTSQPVALVTGSHHYLAFWLSEGRDRELRQLPFVYQLREKSWTPRREAFLEPPDAPPHIATWNSNCIQCHAVAGEPQETEWRDAEGSLHVRYRSRVAELGIACEACHGPGRAHADSYRNPLRRAADRFTAQTTTPGPGRPATAAGTPAPGLAPRPEAALVNPAKLDSAAQSAICGQCHAYFVPTDETAFWQTGFSRSFSPGQALAQSRHLLSPDSSTGEAPLLSRELASIFWPDGTIRVGGREYGGLSESACYARGQGERQLGCGSCHSMHDSDPSDQLTREAAKDPDTPCRTCHSGTAEHSGHPLGTVGASCVNCHMPKTAYALQKSIRSHRIQSPQPARRDVPSACSLCHVDRPLAWFAPRSAAPDAEADVDPVGVGIRAALSGNAAERAIYAAALASSETQQTVGEPLVRALLQALTRDRYHAVRHIAERGLAELGTRDLVGPDAPSAPPDLGLLRSLEAARDDRDIVISE